jgi:hypothetical protein
MITAAVIVIGLFVAWLLFRTFFDDLEDFIECAVFLFTPRFFSAWGTREWGSAKIYLYVAICAGCGYGTYWDLHKWLG